MTARRVLDTQKLKANGATLEVDGHVREILSSQCDFPLYVRESIQNFPEFDFKRVKKDIDQLGEFFVANYLENEESAQEFKKLANTLGLEGNLDAKADAYINILKNRTRRGTKCETNFDVYNRVQKAKQMVKEYIKEKDLKDGQLIIVAHSRFIKAWTCKGVDKSLDEFIDMRIPMNCETLEVEL